MTYTTIRDTLSAQPARWNINSLNGFAGILQYNLTDAADGDVADFFLTFDGSNPPTVTEGQSDDSTVATRMAAADYLDVLNGVTTNVDLREVGKLFIKGPVSVAAILGRATPRAGFRPEVWGTVNPPPPSAAYLSQRAAHQEAIKATKAELSAKVAAKKASMVAPMALRASRPFDADKLIEGLKARHPSLKLLTAC